MQPRPPEHSQVTEAAVRFYSGSLGSLGLCLAVHFLAPSLSADGSMLRMGLVIVFFAGLASATWSLSEPYRDYNNTRMRWRFGNAPPSVRQSVERYLIRVNRIATTISTLATIGVGLIGLGVLSSWPMFAPINDYGTVLFYFGFGALAATPLVVVSSVGQLREARALRQQIDEEMQISGATVRDERTESASRSEAGKAPIELVGPMRFRAGGYEWNVSDFYKNAAIFGQSGSGKTICVLNAILDGLLVATEADNRPAAGLILDPKGDFHGKIGRLARTLDRAGDLLVIDPAAPETSMRWNPLDSDDDAQEIAGRFAAVMEILNPGGEKDRFWIDSARRLVENLIALIRFARHGEPPSLLEIYEAAMSDTAVETWLQQISDTTYASTPEVGRTIDFFDDVWKPMPGDMRGTIRSFVSNMLGSFLKPPYDTLFSGRSSVTLGEVLDEGRILYVNMPIAEKEVMARVVSTFIKLEFYREVLKRRKKSRPSFFLCDEFQSFFTVGQGRGDADAFERTRESNHANIVAFQNLNALFKQTDRREPVLNMLGNCATKIFLRNTEKETNEFASELFGEHVETLSGGSVNIAQGVRGGTGGTSFSGSAQYAATIRKDEFAALEVPSVDDGIPHADSIVHLAARSRVETRRMRWKVHPIGEI